MVNVGPNNARIVATSIPPKVKNDPAKDAVGTPFKAPPAKVGGSKSPTGGDVNTHKTPANQTGKMEAPETMKPVDRSKPIKRSKPSGGI